MTVAALYVAKDGPYFDLEGVDPWDEMRDARLYGGPHPVVAHPPCARWGRYWNGGPSAKVKRKLGDDGGCFTAALEATRIFGGVLENPEGSHAWRAFGFRTPSKRGGWEGTLCGGWTCCVEQGHYGHRARKATWLYVHGVTSPPSLIWGPSEGKEGSMKASTAPRSAGDRRGPEFAKGSRNASANPRAVPRPAFVHRPASRA